MLWSTAYRMIMVRDLLASCRAPFVVWELPQNLRAKRLRSRLLTPFREKGVRGAGCHMLRSRWSFRHEVQSAAEQLRRALDRGPPCLRHATRSLTRALPCSVR